MARKPSPLPVVNPPDPALAGEGWRTRHAPGKRRGGRRATKRTRRAGRTKGEIKARAKRARTLARVLALPRVDRARWQVAHGLPAGAGLVYRSGWRVYVDSRTGRLRVMAPGMVGPGVDTDRGPARVRWVARVARAEVTPLAHRVPLTLAGPCPMAVAL